MPNGELHLDGIIVRSLGYSVGFALALFAGWFHGDSLTHMVLGYSQVIPLMLAMWASSLSFFYFYTLLFNTRGIHRFEGTEVRNHLTVSALVSTLSMAVFLACARIPLPLLGLPAACCVVYLLIARQLARLYAKGKGSSVRFQLIVPVMAATAVPYSLGCYLAQGDPSALVSTGLLVAYFIVFLAFAGVEKRAFVAASLLLVGLVGGATLFLQSAPFWGEMSSVLFMSILIATVSGVFESWRMADDETNKKGDYFLSSSLALVAAIMLFPLIITAGGFSDAAYYAAPLLLLIVMTLWCTKFERLHGKWRITKTVVGFLFLGLLLYDSISAEPYTPADATLVYNAGGLESLAMAMALFGLYGGQVSSAFNEAKRRAPSSVIDAGRLFFKDRLNFFRFIGSVSSMAFCVMYVVQNILAINDVGAIDLSDLMGEYMYIALLCAVFDFILVFFVSDNTLKGDRLNA